MTAVLDAAPDTRQVDAQPDDRLASWRARTGAFAVDVLPGAGVVATMALVAWAAPPRGWLWWVVTVLAAATVIALAVNRYLLPSMTGWSVGRALFGIRVVTRDGTAAGLGRLLVRDLAHLLDTGALFIGWLWPLWDDRRRTFADLVVRTEVRCVDRPQRDMRRPAAVLLVAAVLLSVAGVGLGYLGVFRQERAVDQARAQISEQGPRLVEQMLSYGVDTMDDDFARARSVVTDSYREQLAVQQEAVKQAEPSTNEYWAVNSAVLSVQQDEAAMLLAMQGQRGTDPQDLSMITATVRADFEKSGDGQWRVDNLTVLKRPQYEQAGQ